MAHIHKIKRIGLMILLFLLAASPLLAEQGINIELLFRNNISIYEFGQPVPMGIRVYNASKRSILINHGFKTRNFHLDLKIIDPAGRLILPRLEKGKRHQPSYPLPLPFIKYNDKPVRVAPCEVLLKQYENKDQWIKDIRQYYPLVLPGFYFVQARIPVMIFEGEVCDINDKRWTGILSSEIKHFFINGGTEVIISPKIWNVSYVWDHRTQKMRFGLKDENGTSWGYVKIEIKYEKGKKRNDYNKDSFYWDRKVKLRAETWKEDQILTYAKIEECIKSMGQIVAGKSYPISITGRLVNGMPLFGGQEIYINQYSGPIIPNRWNDLPLIAKPPVTKSNQ